MMRHLEQLVKLKIVDNRSAAQPGSVPFPLKYPSLWLDLDWEVEKPYEDTERWKREEHGRGLKLIILLLNWKCL